MVNILIASHSEKLAQGVKDLASQMGPDVKIEAVGGTGDGGLGSDFENLNKQINDSISDDGLVIFFDLGSAMMNCQMIIDSLDEDKKDRVYLSGTPLVESAIEATVLAQTGAGFEEIVENLSNYQLNKLS